MSSKKTDNEPITSNATDTHAKNKSKGVGRTCREGAAQYQAVVPDSETISDNNSLYRLFPDIREIIQVKYPTTSHIPTKNEDIQEFLSYYRRVMGIQTMKTFGPPPKVISDKFVPDPTDDFALEILNKANNNVSIAKMLVACNSSYSIDSFTKILKKSISKLKPSRVATPKVSSNMGPAAKTVSVTLEEKLKKFHVKAKKLLASEPSSVDIELILKEGNRLVSRSVDCENHNLSLEVNELLKKLYDKIHYGYDWVLQFRKLFNPARRCTISELRNLYDNGKALEINLLEFTYCENMIYRCRENKKKLDQYFHNHSSLLPLYRAVEEYKLLVYHYDNYKYLEERLNDGMKLYSKFMYCFSKDHEDNYKGTCNDLLEIVKQFDELKISFPQLEYIRKLLPKAETWIEEMTELLNQKQDTEAVNNKLLDIGIEGFCFGMNGLDIRAKQYIQNSLKYLTEIDSILPSDDNSKNKLTYHILDTLVQKGSLFNVTTDQFQQMYNLYTQCKSWINEVEEAVISPKITSIELEELRDRGKQIPVKTDEMALLELFITHRKYKEKINQYYREKHTYSEYVELIKEGQSLKTSIMVNKKRRQIITKEYKELKNTLNGSEKWVGSVEKYLNSNGTKLDFSRLVELYNEGKDYPNLVYDKLEMLRVKIKECLLFLDELYVIYPHFKPTEPIIILNDEEKEKERNIIDDNDDMNDLPDIINSEPPSTSTPVTSPLNTPLVSPINRNNNNNSGKSPKFPLAVTHSPLSPSTPISNNATPRSKSTPKNNRNLRSFNNNNSVKKEKQINKKVVNPKQKGKKNFKEEEEDIIITNLPYINDVEVLINKYNELNITIPEGERLITYKTEYDNWIKEYNRIFITYSTINTAIMIKEDNNKDSKDENNVEKEEEEKEKENKEEDKSKKNNNKANSLLDLIEKYNESDISPQLKTFLEQCKSLTVLVSKNSQMSNHSLRLLYEKSKKLKINAKNERKYIKEIFKTYSKAKGVVTNYLSNYISYMYNELLKLYPEDYQEIIERKVKENKIAELDRIKLEEEIESDKAKALMRNKNRNNRKRGFNYNGGKGGASSNRLNYRNNSVYLSNSERRTRNHNRNSVYSDDYEYDDDNNIDDRFSSNNNDYYEDYSDIINDRFDSDIEEEEEEENNENDRKMEEEENEVENVEINSDSTSQLKDVNNANSEMEVENNVETVETEKTFDDLPFLSYDKIMEIMTREKELIEQFMKELDILEEIKSEIKILSTNDKRIKSVKLYSENINLLYSLISQKGFSINTLKFTLKKVSLIYKEPDRYGIYGCFCYYRCLFLMSSRLLDWSKRVNANIINFKGNKKSISTIEEIYSDTQSFYLPIAEEEILKDNIERYHKYAETAQKIITKELKLSVSDFNNLVTDCQTVLILMSDYTKPLKYYNKLINNWIKDFIKIDKMTVEEVINMKERLSELPIKEDDYIDILNKQSIVYCVCKEKENGRMICCDICKKWFHDYCFDLENKNQPEIFICPNCLISESLPFHLHELEESISKVLEIQQKSTVGNLDVWIEHIMRIKNEITSKDIEKFNSATYKFLVSSLKLDFSRSLSILNCLTVEFYLVHIILCQNYLSNKTSDKEWLKLIEYRKSADMKYSVYDNAFIQFMNNLIDRINQWNDLTEELLDPLKYNSQTTPAQISTQISGSTKIPVNFEQVEVLENIVHDNYKRYCICNGLLIFNDMVRCSKCRKSYHKKCVRNIIGINRKIDENNYICHDCNDRLTNPMLKSSKRRMPSQYADYETDMVEPKKKRAIINKLEIWYKSNPIATFPTNSEISAIAQALNYQTSRVKKFLCEKLNIPYSSVVGVNRKSYENPNPSLQTQQQSTYSSTTYSHSIPSIINSSSSNAVMSSSTASSSIPTTSSQSQKQVGKEERNEEVEKSSGNTMTYQASFLSSNSSISGMLASLDRSGLAKSNYNHSAKQSDGDVTSVSVGFGYSDNKNVKQNSDV